MLDSLNVVMKNLIAWLHEDDDVFELLEIIGGGDGVVEDDKPVVKLGFIKSLPCCQTLLIGLFLIHI